MKHVTHQEGEVCKKKYTLSQFSHFFFFWQIKLVDFHQQFVSPCFQGVRQKFTCFTFVKVFEVSGIFKVFGVSGNFRRVVFVLFIFSPCFYSFNICYNFSILSFSHSYHISQKHSRYMT